MTLGRFTIFCDCSLSTSLAHLSTTVLGQAFMCVAAATLGLEELVGMDRQRSRQRSRGVLGLRAAFAFSMDPSPRTETAPLADAGRPWPRASAIVLGRSRFLLNLVDIARLRPARPDKLELWR